jgi:hypothetical protein
MWSEPTPGTAAETCALCGADLVGGDDFCRGCGHSVSWREPGAVGTGVDSDDAALERCPACPDGWIRTLPDSHRQCESCGYMERA